MGIKNGNGAGGGLEPRLQWILAQAKSSTESTSTTLIGKIYTGTQASKVTLLFYETAGTGPAHRGVVDRSRLTLQTGKIYTGTQASKVHVRPHVLLIYETAGTGQTGKIYTGTQASKVHVRPHTLLFYETAGTGLAHH